MNSVHRFLLFIVSFWSLNGQAQSKTNDTLWISLQDQRAMLVHVVSEGENLYTIAQQYSVPALVLSQTNDVPFYEKLSPKRKLYVPLGKYNYLKSAPENPNIAKAIYYKRNKELSNSDISQYLSITESDFAALNNNKADKILLMGYVLYDNPLATKKQSVSEPIGTIASAQLAPSEKEAPNKDTAKGPITEIEKIFNYQTNEGLYVDSLDGMVAFFKPQTSVNEDLLFAFSDEIPIGKAIKVTNPSNQNYVFAKVIGPLPKTKQYINAKIGLDGRARKVLETREVKLWCRFYFKY